MSETVTGSRTAASRATAYDLLIGGRWTRGEGGEAIVYDKYRLTPYATVTTATPEQVSAMVAAADAAFRQGAPLAYERGAILDRAAGLLAARRAEFIGAMQAEAGFTATDATGEVSRCAETLRLSGEEARRLAGDVLPLEGAPGQAGRMAFTIRAPLGVVAAITPFNSPLNTVAHKVAPAFAAGNAVVLKPSSNTPVTACLLAEVLIEAGMPPGFLSILHGRGAIAQHLLEDDRVRFFAFTGSTEVGRTIQQAAGLRRTQMELGAISFTIVCDDANLDKALPMIVGAGYRKAGQVCTSVQMLLVHEAIMPAVQDRLSDLVRNLKFGDPNVEDTFVGPLISEAEAERVESWIDNAVVRGATRLVGGARVGAVVPPTLLTGVNANMEVGCREVFGPVICLAPFSSLDEAVDRANDTRYGLAAGIFTNRLDDALAAARKLLVGGVHVNATSSARVDMMPYGGSKDSGFGREGPHYAVREMTEERVVSISTL